MVRSSRLSTSYFCSAGDKHQEQNAQRWSLSSESWLVSGVVSFHCRSNQDGIARQEEAYNIFFVLLKFSWVFTYIFHSISFSIFSHYNKKKVTLKTIFFFFPHCAADYFFQLECRGACGMWCICRLSSSACCLRHESEWHQRHQSGCRGSSGCSEAQRLQPFRAAHTFNSNAASVLMRRAA